MALNSNHLVTLAQQRTWFGVPTGASQPEIDAIYEICINSASDMIERFLDRRLINQSYSQRLDGNAQRRITLDNWPVRSVSAIYDSLSWTFDSSSLIDPSEYLVSEFGITLHDRVFHHGKSNVRIDYAAGYDSPTTPSSKPLPSAIVHACYMLVEWLYSMRSDRRTGITNKSKANESIGFIDGLPKVIADILMPYKNDFAIPDSAPIELR